MRVSSFFPIVSRRLVKKRTETCNVSHLGGIKKISEIKLLCTKLWFWNVFSACLCGRVSGVVAFERGALRAI